MVREIKNRSNDGDANDGDVGSETTCQFMKGQQLESELDWGSVQRITSRAAESCY